MKIGDLVKVKDALGYNANMQNLVGHVGVVLGFWDCGTWVQVHILGKTRPVMHIDLEVIA